MDPLYYLLILINQQGYVMPLEDGERYHFFHDEGSCIGAMMHYTDNFNGIASAHCLPEGHSLVDPFVHDLGVAWSEKDG